jgi:HlyD family secretion protein
VTRVAPYVLDLERQARTVEIEATFDNPQNYLLPGYSADVTVIIDTSKETLGLPTQAIMRGDNVYVIGDDNIIEKRALETGLSNWQFTEILSGLELEDRIVLSVDRAGVKDGAKVELQKSDKDKEEESSNIEITVE